MAVRPENLRENARKPLREILAINASLWVFLNVKFFAIFFALEIFCARKTRSCCQISLPNELVLTILVPDHRAQFGDDRSRIADARVVTDGQTDGPTDGHTFVNIISPACYALHSIAIREK